VKLEATDSSKIYFSIRPQHTISQKTVISSGLLSSTIEVLNAIYILPRVGYDTQQITLRRLGYSEFIALALTLTQFTISQLLPSPVSIHSGEG
jgi:hypothetical protein